MSRKFILVLLAIVCLFFNFGFKTDATVTDQPLVSFSSGALLVEKAPEYSSGWGSIWIMDENPKSGWCCPIKEKISFFLIDGEEKVKENRPRNGYSKNKSIFL